MRQGAHMRKVAMAAGLSGAAALVTAWTAVSLAAGGRTQSGVLPDETGRTTMSGLASSESGMPPPVFRLQAVVARAWADSVSTWKRLLGPQATEVGAVSLRFVSRLNPGNCYGLYAGQGPAYCSGNQTVFVGTQEANRLMARFGAYGEAGITFLIGHEVGHHIQNIHGRFLYLSQRLAHAPHDRADLIRRFELQADCLAGVWVNASEAWANSAHFRTQMRGVLKSVGDETLLEGKSAAELVKVGVHGTSDQRTRWFMLGAESGRPDACNTFSVARP